MGEDSKKVFSKEGTVTCEVYHPASVRLLVGIWRCGSRKEEQIKNGGEIFFGVLGFRENIQPLLCSLRRGLDVLQVVSWMGDPVLEAGDFPHVFKNVLAAEGFDFLGREFFGLGKEVFGENDAFYVVVKASVACIREVCF
jgi:hypothetical protein